MNQINTEIYLSDLTYEVKESLKENIMERLRDDKETMKEVQKMIDEDLAELLELKIENKISLESRINMALEDMATGVLESEFYGEITIGDDY